MHKSSIFGQNWTLTLVQEKTKLFPTHSHSVNWKYFDFVPVKYPIWSSTYFIGSKFGQNKKALISRGKVVCDPGLIGLLLFLLCKFIEVRLPEEFELKPFDLTLI